MNLWMRWLDFRAMRDLLVVIGAHPHGLRANELERIATEERLLLRHDGRPYAPSIHYHHRRTLERLGLLRKQGHRFALNGQIPETTVFADQARLREPLDPPEKAAFANTALRNPDCYDVFFSSFLPSPVRAPNVATFVDHAQPVELVAHSRGGDRSRRVAIRPVGTDEWRLLMGSNAVQAVHFGLRSWCVDQLGFMDATCSASGTYVIYPKHIVPRLSDQELALEMFDAIDFDGDWAMVRIPDCSLATGIAKRVSVDQAKGVLMDWLTGHPDLVAGIPTRVGFITEGLADRQHALLLKGYLRSKGGAYLSHLRIHRRLREHLQPGVSVA